LTSQLNIYTPGSPSLEVIGELQAATVTPWYRRRGLIVASAVLLVATGAYLLRGRHAADSYTTTPVTRGDIVRMVNATGTINPVISVQVGTYVSGPIQAIYADFNAQVKKGQLIAKIDPKPFALKVAEARANLANSQAELEKDRADKIYKRLLYKRTRKLLALGAVAEDTVDSNLSGYSQANAKIHLDEAVIQQESAALDEAEVNLNYTNIVSPVDGTVVLRNVDVGQTVAASFQTPVLFLIAQDLTQMQVDCSVSESDIGNIRPGQTARFRVDAFPDQELEGIVYQVRQAPMTVQNVVTYDVVIYVSNKQLLLKPGMTADVNIVTGERKNVIRIPMEALHFSPHVARADGARPPRNAAGRGRKPARVWLLRDQSLEPVDLAIGLRNADYAELRSGDLREGERILTGETRKGRVK